MWALPWDGCYRTNGKSNMKSVWAAIYAGRKALVTFFVTVVLLYSTTVLAQKLHDEDAPFYNGLYGKSVEHLAPVLRALAKERANPNASIVSISTRINDVLDLLLEHDVKLAARLGKRMRIGHGFYLNAPLTDYQFRTALLEAEALVRLGSVEEALQPALPIFQSELNLRGNDRQLFARWERLKISLLNGMDQESSMFREKLAEARRQQDKFREAIAPVLAAYGNIRQFSAFMASNPDEATKVIDAAKAIYELMSPELPFMADIASYAAWGAYFKQDVQQAGVWLGKLDRELPLFFAIMPIHPGGVYASWSQYQLELNTSNHDVSGAARNYSERAYTLLKLQHDGVGYNVGLAAINLAAIMNRSGDTLNAEIMRQHALALINDNENGAGNLLLQLGLETTLIGQYELAEKLFSRALLTPDATGERGSQIVENILNAWADTLTNTGKFDQAKLLYERLLDTDKEKPDGPTRASITYFNRLSDIAGQTGDDVGEDEALNRAMQLAKRILPPDDPVFAELEATKILRDVNRDTNSQRSIAKSDETETTQERSSARGENNSDRFMVRFAKTSAKLADAIRTQKPELAKIELANLKQLVPKNGRINIILEIFAAQIGLLENDFSTALTHFRKASKTALSPGISTETGETSTLFASHALSAIRVAATLPGNQQNSLVDEAFEVAQNTTSLSVSKALSRAQNRNVTSSNSAAGTRAVQDAELALQRAREELLNGLANKIDVTTAQRKVRSLQTQLRELHRTTPQSPDSFTHQQPVSMTTAINHLEADEALIVMITVPQFATEWTCHGLVPCP